MQPNNPLRVQLTDDPAFTNAMINDGVLRASGPGVLHISAPFGTPGNVLNNGGTIAAIDNATVRLHNKATITGGTLATSGNGTIRGDFPGAGGGTFKDLTNTGTMAIAQNETFGLAGTFTNNGLVRIDAPANGGSGLLMRGATTVLAGTGLYTMNGGAGIAGGDFPGQTAVVGPGLTIRGTGTIGSSGSNFLYKELECGEPGANRRDWSADDFHQHQRELRGDKQRRYSTGEQRRHVESERLLHSRARAELGGTVEALDGSIVRVNNLATIEGGTVTSSGTGTIRGGAPNTNSGGTLKNVTNNGSVAVPPGELLGVAGTFVNNGSVRIEASSNQDAALVVRDNVVLSGNGSFTMSGGFRAIFAGADVAGRTVTVTPGFAIRGDGRIGDNSSIFQHKTLRLVNQGTIEAPGYMWIGVNSSQNADFINQGGVLRLGSGGYLEVNGPGTLTNNGALQVGERRHGAIPERRHAGQLQCGHADADRRHLYQRRHVEPEHRPGEDECRDGYSLRRDRTVLADQLDDAKQRHLCADKRRHANVCGHDRRCGARRPTERDLPERWDGCGRSEQLDEHQRRLRAGFERQT
jgi:hypothetical protein